MERKQTAGHLAALFTVFIWGTTFISTKILLVQLAPVEILFFRFVLGFLALLAAAPRRLKGTDWRQELTFLGAGLCGVCLYYLLENIALTYSMASNIGVILSVAPFFTALLAHWLLKEDEPLGPGFFIGFVVAMGGIALMSLNGAQLQLNPLGDVLAVLAALVWAFYSLLTRRIGHFGYPVVLTTRRIFFYGLVCMVPALFLFDFRPAALAQCDAAVWGNLLYLGIGASALCFVTWNFAIQTLGAVKTSVYIYLTPIITVVASVLILHEPLTLLSIVGTALILAGLFLSQRKAAKRPNPSASE